MEKAILAAILSIIPGLGQVYLKQYLRGIIFFIVVVFLAGIIASIVGGLISIVSTTIASICGIIPTLIWLYNIYDAYKLGKSA